MAKAVAADKRLARGHNSGTLRHRPAPGAGSPRAQPAGTAAPVRGAIPGGSGFAGGTAHQLPTQCCLSSWTAWLATSPLHGGPG